MTVIWEEGLRAGPSKCPFSPSNEGEGRGGMPPRHPANAGLSCPPLPSKKDFLFYKDGGDAYHFASLHCLHTLFVPACLLCLACTFCHHPPRLPPLPPLCTRPLPFACLLPACPSLHTTHFLRWCGWLIGQMRWRVRQDRRQVLVRQWDRHALCSFLQSVCISYLHITCLPLLLPCEHVCPCHFITCTFSSHPCCV